MKKVEIITIGDEILIGQIVDTNSAWMAVELNKAGFEIAQITSVHDDKNHILDSVDQAFLRADIVLMTGGIGPTKDDITKHTLCEYFDTELIFSQEEYLHIEQMFTARGRKLNELTKSQALVPAKAKILRNKLGTAPVTWFEKEGKILVSMPGVPYEMKAAMSDDVIPELIRYFGTSQVLHRTMLVAGFPESELAMKIADWENDLPQEMKLAYLPNFGIVKLRLSISGNDQNALESMLDAEIEKLTFVLGLAIIAYEDVSLEVLVGQKLKQKALTLSTAESCTGGLIASKIVSVPGSSEYFKGSVVAYDNQVKENVLGVSAQALNEQGAVSREVVEAMALGACRLLNTDIALATSGIAGPAGGTIDKPVGTVWISVRYGEESISRMFQFNLSRSLNIERTYQTSMLMLLECLG